MRMCVPSQRGRQIGDRGEPQALWIDPALPCRVAQSRTAVPATLLEPQHTARHHVQQLHPDVEDLATDLACIVETAEHEGIVGQVARLARDHRRLRHVGNEQPARHSQQPFRVERRCLLGHQVVVDDQVVLEVRSQGATVTEQTDLQRRHARCEDLRTRIPSIAAQIDQDLHTAGAYLAHRRRWRMKPDIDDLVGRAPDASLDLAFIGRSAVEYRNPKLVAIMPFDQRSRRPAHGIVR